MCNAFVHFHPNNVQEQTAAEADGQQHSLSGKPDATEIHNTVWGHSAHPVLLLFWKIQLFFIKAVIYVKHVMGLILF